jgi:hypothetical protein
MDRLSAVVGMHQRATAPHAASGATGGLRTFQDVCYGHSDRHSGVLRQGLETTLLGLMAGLRLSIHGAGTKNPMANFSWSLAMNAASTTN